MTSTIPSNEAMGHIVSWVQIPRNHEGSLDKLSTSFPVAYSSLEWA